MLSDGGDDKMIVFAHRNDTVLKYTLLNVKVEYFITSLKILFHTSLEEY